MNCDKIMDTETVDNMKTAGKITLGLIIFAALAALAVLTTVVSWYIPYQCRPSLKVHILGIRKLFDLVAKQAPCSTNSTDRQFVQKWSRLYMKTL